MLYPFYAKLIFNIFLPLFYSEQSTQNGALDPRAGRVDVVMPELKFDPHEIVQQLEDLKYKKFTRVRNRKCIDRIITTYKKFAGGIFPIGIQKLDIDRDELKVPDVDEKAEELLEFENELYGKQRQLKKINKRKRKKIVSNQDLFDEFQAKSNKIAKIKHKANAWTEEDIVADEVVVAENDIVAEEDIVAENDVIAENEVSVAPKKPKKSKKLKKKETQSHIFVDKETPSSAEKRVKIALKMNQSQEVTEYIRQLKQSPHPYDSAKKPSKGVLKPNLAPSPINPFYKRLIGIE